MELTLDQALQKGIEAHKAGNVHEADQYYTAILKANPKHPDANHNMGVLAVGLGKVEAALPFFKTALETNKSMAQYWLSYIDALIKLGRFEDAKDILDQAKSNGAKGDGFDQLTEQFNTPGSETEDKAQNPPQDQLQSLIKLYNEGLMKQALEQSKALSRQYPNSAILANIQGVVFKGLEQLNLSVKAYKKAISIQPKYAEAYNNMGVSLKDQGKLEEAIDAYRKAISVQPDYAEAYNNMGNALKDHDKLKEAIEAYNKALLLRPDNAEAYINMGNALQDQGKLEEAINAYNKALSIKPDYAEAYTSATELLKIYSPKNEGCHSLFSLDSKIKELSKSLIIANSNEEIARKLREGLHHISKESFRYKTPLSQIYKRDELDLNCKRHTKIFETKNIIPEFCFGCFKVQVEVSTFMELIKITSLFYKFDFEKDLTSKTIIELRPYVSGYYKGLIYCRGLAQAKAVKDLLDIKLKKTLGGQISSNIKRGCSEFPFKFPDYGKIEQNPSDMMNFPKKWKIIENKFDETELIEPYENRLKSLKEFCLSDFYIIQKWIDYAKGIGDQSIEIFDDLPIVHTEIYEAAKIRSLSV